MKKYFLLIFFLGCYWIVTAQVSKKKASSAILTYKKFSEQNTEFGYHKIGRTVYKIARVPDSLISRGDGFEELKLNTGEAIYYPGAVTCSGNTFAGEKRAEAKTHESNSSPKVFSSFDDFFSSGLLVAENQMRDYSPPITTAPESPRVREELINVTISNAFIYGIYKENDNDFHMIIGNGKTGTSMHILNAEVSGLPGNSNDPVLTTVRNKIIKMFGDISCGSGAYKPVGKLIPIKITGSLFFDVDHGAGSVGFPDHKPHTVWEIHPITDLQFLDE